MSTWLLALMLMRQAEPQTMQSLPMNYAASMITAPTTLTFGVQGSEPLLTMSLKDGKVIFGSKFTPDEASRLFWQYVAQYRPPEKEANWVEEHCVAVLVEEHDEKHHSEIIYGDLMPGRWGAGQDWTEHIPEQTLKLRCKP